MQQAVLKTDFNFTNQEAVYHGKVRDVYTLKGGLLAMVVSDRLSAFDVVMPWGIPGKGQVLNMIAAVFLDATRDILPNWKLAMPDPMVTVGYKCQTYPVEMVVRGYLSGHAWREYKAGKRTLCGVALPEGLRENEKLPTPIITPTTKAAEGHDEDISREDIIARGIVKEEEYRQLEKYALALFARGTEMAAKQGLILVDTKYEFGNRHGQIMLIDEIHTPDSSRYFYSEGYQERLEKGEPQRQLSKEFVRQWLMDNGFNGQEGQQIPALTPERQQEITGRYVELYEKITGKKFDVSLEGDPIDRIQKNVESWIAQQ
ncbi:MAG: phosphoribosylaminoimidazolesuccinocarboxamide synthase [Bacteroidetes bacterium]|nr:MAG: phosphoribosylaminoimidazolesuccinocarboxamide synthase [Bacteroidota bacterium]